MQNFGVTIQEHYGMLWYFLEWSIVQKATYKYLQSSSNIEKITTFDNQSVVRSRLHHRIGGKRKKRKKFGIKESAVSIVLSVTPR